MIKIGGRKMNQYFSYDERLGIEIPVLQLDWEEYPESTQQLILLHWEERRGAIPDRIALLEQEINRKQAQLYEEEDFERSCQLNEEIAELASIINDLWLWFRMNQEVIPTYH